MRGKLSYIFLSLTLILLTLLISFLLHFLFICLYLPLLDYDRIFLGWIQL